MDSIGWGLPLTVPVFPTGTRLLPLVACILGFFRAVQRLLRKPFPPLVFNPGCEARPEATPPRDGESFCSARRRELCNSLFGTVKKTVKHCTNIHSEQAQ